MTIYVHANGHQQESFGCFAEAHYHLDEYGDCELVFNYLEPNDREMLAEELIGDVIDLRWFTEHDATIQDVKNGRIPLCRTTPVIAAHMSVAPLRVYEEQSSSLGSYKKLRAAGASPLGAYFLSHFLIDNGMRCYMESGWHQSLFNKSEPSYSLASASHKWVAMLDYDRVQDLTTMMHEHGLYAIDESAIRNVRTNQSDAHVFNGKCYRAEGDYEQLASIANECAEYMLSRLGRESTNATIAKKEIVEMWSRITKRAS